jgi:hypothetical protein
VQGEGEPRQRADRVTGLELRDLFFGPSGKAVRIDLRSFDAERRIAIDQLDSDAVLGKAPDRAQQ